MNKGYMLAKKRFCFPALEFACFHRCCFTQFRYSHLRGKQNLIETKGLPDDKEPCVGGDVE